MTSVFVVLPDSLFCNEQALSQYKFHSQIFLCEDPVIFNKDSSKTKLVTCRTALKSYHVWLDKVLGEERGQLKKITYINVDKILEKGPTVFDYFISIGSSLHMWRPNSMWSYGEAPYTYTYAGLNVVFVESPAFVINYRSARDDFRQQRYALSTVLNKMAENPEVKKICSESAAAFVIGGNDVITADNLLLSVVDEVSGNSTSYINEHFPNITGKVTSQITNCSQADNLLRKFIEKILPTYKNGDIYVLLGALNIGLLEPVKVLKIVSACAVDVLCKHAFAQDMARREYRRILYLVGMEHLIEVADANKLLAQNDAGVGEITFKDKYPSTLYNRIVNGKFMPQESWIDLLSWCIVSGVDDKVIVTIGKKLPWGFDWNMQINQKEMVKKYRHFKLSENMPVDAYKVLLSLNELASKSAE